jgi:uncharacterized protein
MPPNFVHGQLSYLQLPAKEIEQSAAFYETVFHWKVDGSSFDASDLFGQWVTDREPSPDSGPLLWLHVEDVAGTLEIARLKGAAVVSPPEPDGPTRWVATFRDPGGNTIGIVSHR